jgi:hypothetical protein
MDPRKYADAGSYESIQARRDINPDSFASVAEQADERMSDFLRRLETLTDQLCGGGPATADSAAGGQLRGLPNGYFDTAADHARSVMLKIEQANSCLSRIERALP